MKRTTPLLLLLALTALVLVISACATPEVVQETVVVTEMVEAMPEDMAPEVVIPNLEEWQASPHADASAEAFVHWDEDDPAVVPVFCAKCHTGSGYKDYLGADGSEFGSVEAEVPVGEVISCDTCHNDATASLDSVMMPSGVEITGLGAEARCMQCHQGRASSLAVDESIAELGIEDEDAVNEELGFINIHYYAATATKYGTLTKGGYEYAGNTYDSRFDHVEGFQTCIDCHDSHTLEVKVESCTACHSDVESVEDLKNVRMAGSLVDYDGDGDLEEGIAFEIAGLQELLYQAIQAYAADVSGAPVVYDSHAYPYFFNDDGNGEVDDGEAIFPNASMHPGAPRLLKAAYNYQVSQKDPGAFAHGGKYIIQLLYDSIEDLNTGIDISAANRIDHGHFAGSEEAFRHWDEDGAVPGSCSRCHSAEGLGLFLTEGVTVSQEPSNGFTCATCHTDLDTYARYEVTEVTFPSGATVETESALCMTCHQGRSSTNSVNNSIDGLAKDTPTDQIRFINIHYFAAGATRYGDEAKGAYQYDGKNYVGLFEHVEAADECFDCHNAHALEVEVDKCSQCHDVSSAEDLMTIRGPETPDYDGDGDTEEGVAGEIDGLAEILYAAIARLCCR